MSDTVLGALKIGWLILLYLFIARVVFVVSRELKGTPVARVSPRATRDPEPRMAAPKPAPATRWNLVVHEPESLRGTTVAIREEITVGRGGGCAISLPADTFVSTVHARVAPRGNDLWVEDLASTNGTYVNGSQITQPAKLKRGDRIRVGSSEIEVTR